MTNAVSSLTLDSHRPQVSPWLWMLLAAGAGATAAAGALAVTAGLAALLLFTAGARLAWTHTQTILLAALLFVPDVVSGTTLGLQVTWSSGLTWSNFVVPVLALPMLAGAWWAGCLPAPRRWPPLALGMLLLLGWGMVTLLPPAAAGELSPHGAFTICAHVAKLVLFLCLGALLALEQEQPRCGPPDRTGCGFSPRKAARAATRACYTNAVFALGGAAWRRRAAGLLLAAVAVNAVLGLAQAAGWLAVYSPLAAQAQGARATGLFYDANMYAAATAWALAWLLCQSPRGAWRAVWWVLTLAVAGSLVAAGSRAGYLALATALLFLLFAGRRRPLGRAVLLVGLLAVCFPQRSWQRVQVTAAGLSAFLAPAPVAAAPDGSTGEHLSSLQQGLRAWQQHPWLGAGFGRALYLGLPATGTGPVATGDDLYRGAQDMPLSILAASGPLGLLLFLAAVLAPLRRRFGPLPLALRAGYIGLLAASLTQESLWNARLLALAVLVTGLGWQWAAAAPTGLKEKPCRTETF